MNQHAIVQPRLLKGFRDFDPPQQALRNHCITLLQELFLRFGFLPLDSPVLEYEEVLLGKGGGSTDKQVYRFTDKGNRSVAMRFDLTVPFARYIAMHHHTLTFPFFRYQIGKVYRGENTQKGRYREFMQCDFDIIGSDDVSADLTIVQCIIAALQALKLEGFALHLSHREILGSILEPLPPPQQQETLRLLDKLRKIGAEELKRQLERSLPPELCSRVLDCIEPTPTPQDALKKIQRSLGEQHPAYLRVSALLRALEELSLARHVVLDLSITRGLDYYTGLVYETFLDADPDLGSVCSGGRYNKLTTLYSSLAAPGVGASIGLDRLLSVLGTRVQPPHPTRIVLCPMEDAQIPYCHSLLPALHAEGWQAQVYPIPEGGQRSLGAFFKYTDKTNPDFTIVIGSEELTTRSITIKNLHTKEQQRGISLHAGITYIHEQSTHKR